MRRLTLAGASTVTRAFPSSARECSTPRSRVTCECSTPRSRVTRECSTARSLTVQLRGKLTLASDSLASATAYTRECERGHSRTSVECSRVLHPSLACYSRVLDPSLACLILASARPLARVCYLRLLDRSLACVILATARPLACECWKLESSARATAQRAPR